VFFTDARSHKGDQLRHNPRASLALYWQPKGRQVRVEGRTEQVTPAEADSYWSNRPRQSQLAASASHQSARLRSRAELSRGARGSPGSSGARESPAPSALDRVSRTSRRDRVLDAPRTSPARPRDILPTRSRMAT
jgi:pyridoxamine 5'-phosphate oxidase